MLCPQCDEFMVETTVRGVVVDVCLKCRGVWFDPGELAGYLGQQAVAEFPEGLFLTREDLEKRERELREDRIEKRLHNTIEVGGTLMGFAWDLPAYLIEGILDLFNS